MRACVYVPIFIVALTSSHSFLDTHKANTQPSFCFPLAYLPSFFYSFHSPIFPPRPQKKQTRTHTKTGAELDYPVGGSAAVVDALVLAINKHAQTKHQQPTETADRIALSAHVEKIIVENGRAVGIQLRKGGKRVRARKAVVSNASIWDTLKLLPPDSMPTEEVATLKDTPMTGSFMHLHLGIDATGLPADLECHHTVINTWDKIDAPQNMAIISIPTTLDPALAPPGHHVLHCYAAANEPYEPWEGLKTNSPEYLALKKERAEWLWKAVERVIPDVRQRVKVEMVASPLTHERFLRRSRGTYGAGWRAGKESFPGYALRVLGGGGRGSEDNLYLLFLPDVLLSFCIYTHTFIGQRISRSRACTVAVTPPFPASVCQQ